MKPRLTKVSAALMLAFVCLVIFLVPYAGLVGLGPPSIWGLGLAVKARRGGDRRPIVVLAILVNGLWLSLALVFAWAFLASWMGGLVGFKHRGDASRVPT